MANLFYSDGGRVNFVVLPLSAQWLSNTRSSEEIKEMLNSHTGFHEKLVYLPDSGYETDGLVPPVGTNTEREVGAWRVT